MSGEERQQGPKGEQGAKGDKGDPGESLLVPIAQELVAKLVKAVRALKAACAGLLLVCVVLGAGGGYLYHEHQSGQQQLAQLEQYVQQYARHSCQALELITSKSVPKPGNPTANPSREATYEFGQAVLYWEREDGCKTGK